MAGEHLYTFYENEIRRIKDDDTYRFLKTLEVRDGKYATYMGGRLINLSSNDYLGLATDRDLIKSFYGTMDESNMVDSFGPGSTSSRLLTGNHSLYSDLEGLLGSLYSGIAGGAKREALVFASGYHANAGIFSAIAGEGDLILSDSLNHASIIDGIRLSRARRETYPHLDYGRLEEILREMRGGYDKVIIATESVFSMDGDAADLKKLVELKNAYNVMLFVDEAHAAGVFGEKGLGMCEVQGAAGDIDILMATFGKALGSQGAWVVTHPVIKDFLVNRARTLIFSTALPPVVLSWNKFVLERMHAFRPLRERLLMLAARFRDSVIQAGLLSTGSTHIIPIITGDNSRTVRVSAELQERGFLLFPIRPPTVPKGTSRIRVSLTAGIEWEDIEKIPSIIRGIE